MDNGSYKTIMDYHGKAKGTSRQRVNSDGGMLKKSGFLTAKTLVSRTGLEPVTG